MRRPTSISIGVPTHDRRELLIGMLASLRRVALPAGVAVDVTVVCNGCTDGSLEAVSAALEGAPWPWKVLEEAELGVSIARNRFVRESSGELLALLDDDVDVDPNWLEELVKTYEAVPSDLVVGKVELWWKDLERPEWITRQMESLLSQTDHGLELRELSEGAFANSANFSFWRTVPQTVGLFQRGLGRTGKALTSSGDRQFGILAVSAGFRFFYAPSSRVRHYVPPKRIYSDYMERLARQRGRSHVFSKARFGPFQALRTALGRTWLLLFHGSMAQISAWAGEPYRALEHRLFRNMGWGGLEGLVIRLSGRSPVYPPEPYDPGGTQG